jgi:hypothetical protein
MQVSISKEKGNKVREHFAFQHIRSAIYLAEDAKKIEASKNKMLFSRHAAYVSSSLLASAAFLEASINEFFCDLEDHKTNHYPEIGKDKENLIGELWRRGVPRTARYSILEKYDFALILTGNRPLDKSAVTYCDAKILIDFRNALIHFEPEWYSSGNHPKHEPSRFEKRTSGKFELNPFLISAGNSFFPGKCMSANCAQWAFNTAISLVQDFYSSIGALKKSNHFEQILKQT